MTYKNILIIKMSSLGDVIHALPFAAALRETFPDSRISWLVHPQFSAFVPEPPIIDEVLYFDKKAFGKMGWGDKWKTLRETRALLRSKNFDLVIDLQGLFKSAVMAWLTGCPNRIGYCEMREGSRLVSRPIAGAHAHDHVIERYLDVARYLGAKVEKITYPMPALRELGALIKGARCYVSGDTGPLHIATALQKPLVTIYGPTRPDRTGPYGNPRATVLVSPAKCAGCLKKHCDHWTCMGEVTPDQVYALCREKEENSCD